MLSSAAVADPVRFHAVTFDVDGTLYDMRQLARIFVPQAILRRRFFKAYMEAREALRQAEHVGDIRQAQAEGIAERLGCAVEEAEAMTAKYIEKSWTRFSRISPIRGVRTLLETLSERGVRLGLVSDYPAHEKLEGLGLADLAWEIEISAEDLGTLKPHPSVYEAAAAALDVEPGHILHVGDRLDADVGGAKRAGMAAALFTAGNGRQWPGIGFEADFEFDDYRKLADWLGL